MIIINSKTKLEKYSINFQMTFFKVMKLKKKVLKKIKRKVMNKKEKQRKILWMIALL